MLYHTTAWKRVIESAFPHITGEVLAGSGPGGTDLCYGTPVYTVRSWLLGTRIVAVPFASVYDPLVESREEATLLWSAVKNYAKERLATRVEVRTCRSQELFAGVECHVGGGFTHHQLPLDASLGPAELMNTFSESCVRRKIRRAARLGVRVVRGQSESDLNQFFGIFEETRRRLCLPPIPYRFLRAMWTELHPGHLRLYLGILDGQPRGGVLVHSYGDWAVVEFAADDGRDRNSGLNQAVYWEAIQDALREGKSRYSFGRTADTNPTLREYKRRWGTVEEDLGFLRSSPEAGQGRNLKNSFVVKALARRAPKPLLRILGEIAYRHLG